MADIEPPSFSLGLDLDFEFEPQHQPPNAHKGFEDDDNNNEFQLRVSDSDPDDPDPTQTRTLRRLRRGGPGPSSSKPIQHSQQLPSSNSADDDIESFSSEEIENVTSDNYPAAQYHSLCSSSKIPLSGCGILTSQQESKVLNRKRKEDASCPPNSLGASKGKSKLSHLASSPLRRFRLLDSDSDDPSEGVHLNRDASEVGGCSKQNKQKESTQEYCHITCERKTKSSTPISQKQDFWKDFYADKSCAVPTPAFDEFCKEYYAVKQKKGVPDSSLELCSGGQRKNINQTKEMMEHQDLGSTDPPCHRYFLHGDLRIQSLVRSRLPYFCPLTASSDAGNKLYNSSVIDYMRQFSGDGARQQTGRKVNVRESSRRAGKKTKNSAVEIASHASQDWVNPKETNIPKDAGRRRVCADGRSAGQWVTGENGKKVYVTSTGKELTGRLAYMHYRKESGKAFGRSKKKPASKKKSASKKK